MSMVYRTLGKTGLKVSALSFGAWVTFGKQIGDPVAKDLMYAAYDAGVNFFDNAEAYADGQAERVMGAILKGAGWRRSSFLVSSKVFFGWEDDRPNQSGLSRKHIIEGCHAALQRLQVDYLDLYYCHRPDPDVPVAETAWAMHDLITQGKVLYWGTSEWSAAQIAEAHRERRAKGDGHVRRETARLRGDRQLVHLISDIGGREHTSAGMFGAHRASIGTACPTSARRRTSRGNSAPCAAR
nr:aldo/keto reductase [Opitutus sp. ER46]